MVHFPQAQGLHYGAETLTRFVSKEVREQYAVVLPRMPSSTGEVNSNNARFFALKKSMMDKCLQHRGNCKLALQCHLPVPDDDGGRLSLWFDVREESLAGLMEEGDSGGLKWKTFALFPTDVMAGDAYIALQAALRYITVRSVGCMVHYLDDPLMHSSMSCSGGGAVDAACTWYD